MKETYLLLITLLLTVMISSCEHEPLYDMNNAHYIRIYINDSVQNINKDLYHEDVKEKELQLPEVMRVVLCDRNTGQMVSERFLQHVGRDDKGYYIDGYIGAPEGDYKLIAYNFGTETTQIRGEYNFFDMIGYTNHISPMYYPKLPKTAGGQQPSYDQQNILYDPDHLWVVRDDNVKVRDNMYVDTLRAVDGSFYMAETIVETYYIQIKIKGAQWISSSISLLTGMAGSKQMYNNKMIESPPATIYFEMKEREKKTVLVPTPSKDNKDGNEYVETETAVIYATFNSWGKLPKEDSYFRITFSFGIFGGGNQTETLDITRLFTNEEAIEHRWIIIDKEIEIKEPEGGGGGGFTPGVDDWDEIETDIIL